MSSLALPKPIRAPKKCELASSGTKPIFTKRMLSLAEALATMKSIANTWVSPTPTAGPLIAATIGFDARIWRTQPPTFELLLVSLSSTRALKTASISAPAQNPRPAPVRTIPTTSSSSFAALMACASSAPICGVHAFKRSGRCMVSTHTESINSVRIVSYPIVFPILFLTRNRGRVHLGGGPGIWSYCQRFIRLASNQRRALASGRSLQNTFHSPVIGG